MKQYVVDTEIVTAVLEGLQAQYQTCKEIQQQYIAQLETTHVDAPETAMEVIEDLENFAHTLAILGKQWEEIATLQDMVQSHYLYSMLSELEIPEEEPSQPVADEGVEGYDVGVVLGLEFVDDEPPKQTVKSSSFMGLFSTSGAQKAEDDYKYNDFFETSEMQESEEERNHDDFLDVAESSTAEELYDDEDFESDSWDDVELDEVLSEEPEEKPSKKEKKRCKHCTEDSPIPEEREKCCIVKQEKKKKKEKHKDKSKHKKEAPCIDKWAKKLSKWERYAEEHGDAWTEKVLQKVAKKAEKKAEKRGMKAVFKKHKLDRLATLLKED